MSGLDAAFLEIVTPHTAGDPMRAGVLWTNLSLRRLARELATRGFRVSVKVVTQLLEKHGLGRRKALKKRAFKRHPQQDRQFQIIADYRRIYEESGNPILSIDTKKKELIGQFFRSGQTYTQKVIETLDHDYPSQGTGAIYPHGLYDLQRNHGHLNVGTSHDTSRFACDSIAYWSEHFRGSDYPEATSLLALCDGGGSNASNRYVSSTDWKNWLIESAWKFASATTHLTNRSTTPSSTDSSRTSQGRATGSFLRPSKRLWRPWLKQVRARV
jgi:Rhodopirellula transposase DDE domain